jgi:hypothetical protein
LANFVGLSVGTFSVWLRADIFKLQNDARIAALRPLFTKNVAQVLPRYFVDVGFLQVTEIKFQMNAEISHGIEFIAQTSIGFSRISNGFQNTLPLPTDSERVSNVQTLTRRFNHLGGNRSKLPH